VRLWRERFRGGGPQALWEIAPGRGRKRSYDVTRIKAVIDATLQTKPKRKHALEYRGFGARDREPPFIGGNFRHSRGLRRNFRLHATVLPPDG
jgi:hypothetical protein